MLTSDFSEEIRASFQACLNVPDGKSIVTKTISYRAKTLLLSERAALNGAKVYLFKERL